MNANLWMHGMVDGLARASGKRWIEHHRHVQRFLDNRDENLFLGVYDCFEDAAAAAPAHKPLGYDNTASADLYTTQIQATDYAAMFWLSNALQEGLLRVFDLGGHVGIKFYAFRRVLAYPDGLAWTVCDVPAVVARGRELAVQREPQGRLRFTTDPLEASGADVLFASGSLQYLPQSLGQMLDAMANRPRRIIVNITPLHPTTSYFTVNSIGTAYCPYRVQSRAAFVDALTSRGYYRHDEWENSGKALVLPEHPELSLDHYCGFCFDLRRL